jgi:hypothetical protein
VLGCQIKDDDMGVMCNTHGGKKSTHNFKPDVEEIIYIYVDWIQLPQDRVQQ